MISYKKFLESSEYDNKEILFDDYVHYLQTEKFPCFTSLQMDMIEKKLNTSIEHKDEYRQAFIMDITLYGQEDECGDNYVIDFYEISLPDDECIRIHCMYDEYFLIYVGDIGGEMLATDYRIYKCDGFDGFLYQLQQILSDFKHLI